MSTAKDGSASASATESLISRIFIAPILAISFLVSLFLIDRQTYSKVVPGHSSSDDHYHTHQRKMAQREIEDAFRMRNRVLAAAALVMSGIGLAAAGWIGSKVFHAIFPTAHVENTTL